MKINKGGRGEAEAISKANSLRSVRRIKDRAGKLMAQRRSMRSERRSCETWVWIPASEAA